MTEESVPSPSQEFHRRQDLINEQKLFFIEQYKSLRTEIEMLSKENRTTERFVMGSIAALYSFFMNGDINRSLTVKMNSAFFWFLPIILVFFGMSRWWYNNKNIENIADFISIHYEQRLGCGEKGWEYHMRTFREKLRVKYPLGRKAPFPLVEITVWLSVLALTMLIALQQVGSAFQSTCSAHCGRDEPILLYWASGSPAAKSRG